MTRFAVVSLMLLGLGNIFAENLCGPADQKVCLKNSLGLAVDGIPNMIPGATFVISVEGVSANQSLLVSGAPLAPYRLSLEGMLIDDQGGVWSAPTALETDVKGATSIAFTLEENTLTSPIHFQFKNIEVCQYVSDGPGEVKLNVQLFLNSNFGKTSWPINMSFKMNTGFDLCPELAGNLPIPRDHYQTFIANPYDEAAILTIGNKMIRIEPKSRLDLEGDFSASPHPYTSSLPLPLVLWAEDGDLNLVGLHTANHRHWVIPHLARDDQSWTNRWIFATSAATTLTTDQAGDLASTSFQAGVHEVPLFVPAETQSPWLRMAANRSINGFFEFSRTGGVGSAWVNAARATQAGEAGSTLLYLPHVARDTVSFWTGYSLANLNDTATEVRMTGIGQNRATAGEESFTIGPGQNDIGLIGVDRLAGEDGISWVRIESTRPIAGLELIGDNHPSRLNFSGFLLPSAGKPLLSFPVLRADSRYWSGLSFLNVGEEAAYGTLTFYGLQGQVFQKESILLNPGEKELFLAPPGVSHAVYEGHDLLAFCLIGENGGGQIAGYLGR